MTSQRQSVLNVEGLLSTSAPPRHRVGVILGVILLLTLAMLGLAVRGDPLPADVTLAAHFRGLMGTPLSRLVAMLDTLVSVLVWSVLILLVAALFWLLHERWVAIWLIAGLLLGEGTAALAKRLVNRPRPVGASLSDVVPSASFPSGHLVRAIIGIGLIIALVVWRWPAWRLPAVAVGLIFLLLLGAARVASGEHWPTDVLGGMLLGALCLDVLLLAWTWWQERGNRAP